MQVSKYCVTTQFSKKIADDDFNPRLVIFNNGTILFRVYKNMSSMLSVVLAVHNEENSLAACLQAATQVADELIIVDGESTDNSLTIAKQFGAKIIETTNKANFHINKQLAIDNAQYPLILQLDADEVLDSELIEWLTELKNYDNSPEFSQISAWQIARKNYFLGRWLSKGGQYPDYVIRVFRKGLASLPMQNVHEQMQVDGQVGTAQGHLEHFANPSFAIYMKKFIRYTKFEADRQFQSQQKLSIWQYFIWKPVSTCFSLFFRHRGYVDGMAGFVFAVMSSLHHPFVWLQWKEHFYVDQ